VPKHAEEDYSSEELNIKLSRVFVVVLLLHIIAVGGIFTFSNLKDRQNSVVNSKSESTTPKPVVTAPAVQDGDAAKKSTSKSVPLDVQKLIDSSSSSIQAARNSVAVAQTTSAAQVSVEPSEASQVYVVQGGDNPAKIAKKFKVSYADLVKVNSIDDPKKLKIGQKLVIPEK
jgi:LysM repeat protein